MRAFYCAVKREQSIVLIDILATENLKEGGTGNVSTILT